VYFSKTKGQEKKRHKGNNPDFQKQKSFAKEMLTIHTVFSIQRGETKHVYDDKW